MNDTGQASENHFPYKNGFLACVVALLISNISLLFYRDDFGVDQYGGILLSTLLLFNHVAYQYRLPFRLNKFAKIAAWALVLFAFIYYFCIDQR